jgi:protein associated with RNAse G/E
MKSKYTINFYNRFACQEQTVYILAYDELDAKNVFLKHYPTKKYYIDKEEIDVSEYSERTKSWLE